MSQKRALAQEIHQTVSPRKRVGSGDETRRRDWKRLKFIRALTSLPGTRARYGCKVKLPYRQSIY